MTIDFTKEEVMAMATIINKTPVLPQDFALVSGILKKLVTVTEYPVKGE
jgi:hypothetical protein